jgi:DNA-directed RNA polymerase subunit RPC12/RpoP
MQTTLVVQCSRCGGLFLAKADQKTRTCPYCGYQVLLAKARRIASAENAYAASEILRKLKVGSPQEQRNIDSGKHH